MRQKLDEADQTATEAWKPEPGDELIGTVAGWSSGTTRRDETHPILIVELEDGSRIAVWCFYSVLRDELKKADPKIGETILIRRLDDRTNSDGIGYRVYRVAVDREDADPFETASEPVDAPGDWTFSEGGER